MHNTYGYMRNGSRALYTRRTNLQMRLIMHFSWQIPLFLSFKIYLINYVEAKPLQAFP